jgi:thiol-disulfide isomerase/thioredoxin
MITENVFMKAKSPWVLIPLAIATTVGVWLYQKYRLAPSAPWSQNELIREDQTEFKITEFSERKYILLDYFGTWCINCREELPELMKLQDDFQEELKVFLVHEEEAEIMDQFRMQHPELPELLRSSSVFSQSGIHTYPTSYLIRTSDGTTVYSKAGQLTKRDWKVIRKILLEAN